MEFRKLPSNSKKLLDEILQAEHPSDMLCQKLENISPKEDEVLRGMIRELRQEGYIDVLWADDMPYYVTIHNSARTYNEQLEEYEAEKAREHQHSIVTGPITSYGNLIFGNVSGSTLSVDNSVHEIERMIDEKGGEDAEELHDLLEEVKELIENMQTSRSVPKQKKLFQRISDHMAKHGWFYGAVIQLLGTATLTMLGA
ncbi:MAG: hypothetical protein ACI3V5_04205 [Faecousia sp.]